MKLPLRLREEPIVDAVFEVRFSARMPMATILPGVLFSALGASAVERLAGADIPEAVRASDPAWRMMATHRVVCDNFSILVGDESVAVGCRLPYPGWGAFKPAIQKVFGIVEGVNQIERVNRYSLKYVDLLPSKDSADAMSKLQLGVTLGKQEIRTEQFQIRVELLRKQFVQVVSVIGQAEVLAAGTSTPTRGAILDIDSICNVTPAMPYGDFFAKLDVFADEIHDANKELFFECLKPATIEQLGPEYE
ncbi:TIGR04255 family protein [Paraburkholderia sediminicola]|uniref:TIGR04255 family protein n=1 Tax=Paraburkholderia sediminicola TaxID=458836 RepID=UPI0038BD0D33